MITTHDVPEADATPRAASHSGMALEHWLPGSPAPRWTPRLLLREQLPLSGDRSRPVLYVHGATFPSASSVMAKFRESSWADALNAAGHDVFALDFAGYGGSERYPEMDVPARSAKPIGRSGEASKQIGRAIEFIRRKTGAKRISIIAHSWGTMPTVLYAIGHPSKVQRVVLFGPILQRSTPSLPLNEAWSLVTAEAQHRRFIKDVPKDHPPVLEEADFPAWANAYLCSDPQSFTRTPPAVKVPGGPSADVADAWSGRLPYDPADLHRPVMIVSGQWDSSSLLEDAQWFMERLAPSVERRLVRIPKATHLMHLERGRFALYEAVNAFLEGRLEDSS
jgi:pimeloyl-ACP methyl ester carboxylesterase